MSMRHDSAEEALWNLLQELPAEFSTLKTDNPREEFRVVKERNVRKVHESLITLQEYFGIL